MPYKDPECKRQWEQEHREERNARRRRHLVPAREMRSIPEVAHDPLPDQDLQSSWRVITGLAMGIGIVLLAALIIRWAINHARKRNKPEVRSARPSMTLLKVSPQEQI